MFKKILLPALLLTAHNFAAAEVPIGIMGGQHPTVEGIPLALRVSAPGVVSSIDLSSVASSGGIIGASINNSGSAIIGGQTGEPFVAFAALISDTGATIPLALPQDGVGTINSVAINNSGTAIMGGEFFPASLGYFVSPTGGLTPLEPIAPGNIVSVSINESGAGILGGQTNFPSSYPIAYLASNEGVLTPLDLPMTTNSIVKSVDINDSGIGILSGIKLFSNGAFAYQVSQEGNLTPITPIDTTGSLFSVTINNYGTGLIGGISGTGSQSAIAYLVSSSAAATPLDLPSTPHSLVDSVALNNSGQGIIGGRFSNTTAQIAFAYLVSPTGTLTQLNLPQIENSVVAVAINEFGVGLLSGYSPLNNISAAIPFAYLISPTGTLTPLNLSFLGNSTLLAISISSLSKIPTQGLHGNNRVFANYINNSAPYDAYYFVPALFEGVLADALMSAAPTRNAFALYAADNNLFMLSQSLSRHSQVSRQSRHLDVSKGILLAANENKTELANETCPYQIWFDLLGAASYQKAEHQSPAFQPYTAGAILAFDAHASDHGWYGGGAAYTYTHIHESHGFGHSHINQEYLFAYGLWNNQHWYGDAAIWGGLFQIDQVRNTEMPGFSFQSKSHPKGWQLNPHVEVGYEYDHSRITMLEPFVMLDWVSNWQNSYNETGSGPFNAGVKDHYSSFLRSEAGLRFYETINFTSWRLVLQEKGSYINKKPFQVGTTTAFIIGAPGSFTVETLTTPQNLGAVEMQLIFESNKPCYPYGTIDYQGEFAPISNPIKSL